MSADRKGNERHEWTDDFGRRWSVECEIPARFSNTQVNPPGNLDDGVTICCLGVEVGRLSAELAAVKDQANKAFALLAVVTDERDEALHHACDANLEDWEAREAINTGLRARIAAREKEGA